MLCPVALFDPPVDLSDLLQLLICHGVSVEKCLGARMGGDPSPERGQAVDRFLGMVLSEHPSDEGSRVTLAREGVAADPHLMAGGEVRGEAEAGRVALGHGLSVCVLVSVAWGATPDQSRSLMFQMPQVPTLAWASRVSIAWRRWRSL